MPHGRNNVLHLCSRDIFLCGRGFGMHGLLRRPVPAGHGVVELRPVPAGNLQQQRWTDRSVHGYLRRREVLFDGCQRLHLLHCWSLQCSKRELVHGLRNGSLPDDDMLIELHSLRRWHL